jgi:pimeloyl-ACP methyl ester carboxylesterase
LLSTRFPRELASFPDASSPSLTRRSIFFAGLDAESIRMPTLFVGGGDTKGLLPLVLRALAAHVPDSRTAMIPDTSHWMFEQAPQKFCEIVLEFLGES